MARHHEACWNRRAYSASLWETRMPGLFLVRGPTISVGLGQRGSQGCGSFRAEIGKVPGKLKWVGHPPQPVSHCTPVTHMSFTHTLEKSGLEHCLSNVHMHKNNLEILSKMKILNQSSGWDPRVYISNKRPGDIDVAGAWTTLWPARAWITALKSKTKLHHCGRRW